MLTNWLKLLSHKEGLSNEKLVLFNPKPIKTLIFKADNFKVLFIGVTWFGSVV